MYIFFINISIYGLNILSCNPPHPMWYGSASLACCLNRRASSSPSYSLDPMITRLHMPLPNVNMPCLLLFWLVIFVLFHCRASSPAQYSLASPYGASRDKTPLIVTQCLGLPPLYSHPTIPLSVHYALNLFFPAQKPAPFTLCSECTR